MIYQEQITKEEAIRQIEQVYHAEYDSRLADFDAYEQLLACKSLAETEAEELRKNEETNEDINVKWNGNGTYKRRVTFELTQDKLNVIAELNTLTYETSPILIAQRLEKLLSNNETRDEHWLYIAQNWNPRAINRVINYMVKAQNSGTRTIQNPAAYFTLLIKRRKRRKFGL